MVKKVLVTILVFAVVGGCVFGACYAIGKDDGVGVVSTINEDSACPVVKCANGECHGFDNVPTPDGVSLMTCPEVSCSDAECHAWDTLMTRYHQASDASLNVWVLAPIVLVVGLVLILKKVR